MLSTREPRLVAGRYELRGVIARGGMGEVYAARDLRLDRDVAVKRLRDALPADRAARARVEREARLAATLNHRNVVSVFDVGIDRGRPFIVMERLDGGSLRDVVSRGAMSESDVRRVASDVLAALAAAHGRGLVHRDIKPENVLLADDGSWKVADFGIARETRDGAITLTGEVLGSPGYIAPECVAGDPATPRSDLYSVGVTMYEALAGRPAFASRNALHLALMIRDGACEPIGRARPDADARLTDAIERAMRTDPSERFGSAEAMAAAFARPSPRSAGQTTVLRPVGVASHGEGSGGGVASHANGSGGGSASHAEGSGDGVAHASRDRTTMPLAAAEQSAVLRWLVAAFVIVVLVAALGTAWLVGQRDTSAPRTTGTGPTPAAANASPAASPVPARLDHALDRLDAAVRP